VSSLTARAALAALVGLALLSALSCGGAGGGFSIVFDSNRDGDLDIYTMSEDGTGVRQLVNEDGRDFEPDVSADGKTIVYASQPKGSDNTRLNLMEIDGGNRRLLTSGPAAGLVVTDDYPHWSPDGKRIVFQRTTATDEGVDADLWLIDVETGEETQLTDTPDAWDSTPSFAADGNSVVFESSRDRQGSDVYRLDLRTREVARLTAEPGNDLEAKESPDGRHVVFASERDGDYEVYVMDVDGGNVRQLTDDEAVDRCAHWSPDGSRLSFYSERDGDREIYVMRTDGSDQRRLTSSPGVDEVPAWVAD
jgi:Tol biopolymer transport system component